MDNSIATAGLETTLVLIVIGYLLGSIPFGLLLTRAAGLGDIRKVGSGNIGATNVLRTGRRDIAAATLLLDGGKAALAYVICAWTAVGIEHFLRGDVFTIEDYSPLAGYVGGASAFVGHCFPVWLKFKGGKGVATFLGLLIAADLTLAIIFAVAWLATAFLSRMSSLAALVATVAVPAAMFFLHFPMIAVAIIGGLGVLIFWRHSANISRLLKGTEPKIGAKKEEAAEAVEGKPWTPDMKPIWGPRPDEPAKPAPKPAEPLPDVPLPRSHFARPSDKPDGGS